MAYDSALPAILNTLETLGSSPAERADGVRESFPVTERRFLARTAQQWAWNPEDKLCILCVLLGDTICDVRAEAYYSLLRCSELHGEPLLSELEKHPEGEPWVQMTRMRLLRRLATTNVRRVLDLLCPMAQNGTTWVQPEVAACLSTCWTLDREVTWQVIESWLHHGSASVREAAVRFVSTGRWPGGSTVPAVLQFTVNDPVSRVRAVCARGISMWACEDLDLAIPALKTLARDRAHWNVRRAVARGLTHWRKAAPYEALEVLLPLLRDGVFSVRRLAFRHLRALQSEFTGFAVNVSLERPDSGRSNEDAPRSRSGVSRRAGARRRGERRVLS